MGNDTFSTDLQISDIAVLDAENYRSTITSVSIFELSEDIKSKGVTTPVLVCPRFEDTPVGKQYQLVSGFRRVKASLIAGIKTVPAVVRPMSKVEAIVFNLTENIQREDPSISDEAKGIRKLLLLGYTRLEIAKMLSKSPGWVSIRMQLLDLPKEIQEMAAAGQISADQIQKIYKHENVEDRLSMARLFKSKREASKNANVRLKVTSTVKKMLGKVKRTRTKKEIDNLLEHLLDMEVPFGLYTRALAWSSGTICDDELAIDIQNYCVATTKLYKMSIGERELSREDLALIVRDLSIDGKSYYELPKFGFPSAHQIIEVE